MLLADAQESGALEREALERAVSTVEVVVLATSRMSDSAIRMTAKQRPVVVLNRAVTDVPCVITDNPRGMRRAVEHLAGLGHRRITYVAGPEASWADGMRWRSLREAAVELEVHGAGSARSRRPWRAVPRRPPSWPSIRPRRWSPTTTWWPSA